MVGLTVFGCDATQADLSTATRVLCFIVPALIQGTVGNVLEPYVFGKSLNLTAIAVTNPANRPAKRPDQRPDRERPAAISGLQSHGNRPREDGQFSRVRPGTAKFTDRYSHL